MRLLRYVLVLTGVLLAARITDETALAQERELGPDVRLHSAFQSRFLSKPLTYLFSRN
jgi:hypothetical protein